MVLLLVKYDTAIYFPFLTLIILSQGCILSTGNPVIWPAHCLSVRTVVEFNQVKVFFEKLPCKSCDFM